MSVPDPAGSVVRRPVDLRLVPPALACWGVAAWAVAQPAGRLALLAAAAAAVVVGALALVLRGGGRAAVAVLLTATGVLGVLAVQAEAAARRDAQPLHGWAAERAVARVTGVASSDATRVRPGAFPGPPRYVLRVTARSVEARGARAAVRVPVLVVGGPAWAGISAGRPVAFTARLASAPPADGVAAVASALGPPRAGPSGAVWRAADRVRAGLRTACAGLGADARGLLPALVVGDTANLPPSLVDALRAAGLTHLTAVSGANVAIVAGAALWAVSVLGAGRSTRLWLALAAVAGFVVLARPQPSVLRAAVMGTVALAGLLRGRRVRGVPLVCAAVVVLLVVVPGLSRSAGFALSVTATLALVLLAPAWAARLQRWMPRPAALALSVPAAAQAACGPIVVLLAPAVPLTAVPANLLAAPAVAPATLLGVAAAVLSQVWPPAAAAAAWCGGLAAGWIAGVARRAAAVPGASVPWVEGAPGALLLLALTLGVVALTLRVAPAQAPPGAAPADRPRPASVDRPRPVPAGRPRPVPAGRSRPAPADRGSGTPGLALAVLAVVAALAAGWLLGPAARGQMPALGGTGDGWAVALCDVGQGDMLVLRSGPARGVVVDAGPDPPAADRCLRDLGVRAVDLVVLTHFHADHVLGLPGVLDGRPAGSVLVSRLRQPAENADAVARWAAAAGSPVDEGVPGASGAVGAGGWQVTWRVLAAARPAASAAGRSGRDDVEGSEVNESSLTTEMVVTGPAGSVRVVGLGDLEDAGQAALAAALRSGAVTLGGPVDVVKVAHHGSATQDRALYAALGAPVALIGVGAGNDYGHPAPRTLALLRSVGSLPVRTDQRGTIRVEP